MIPNHEKELRKPMPHVPAHDLSVAGWVAFTVIWLGTVALCCVTVLAAVRLVIRHLEWTPFSNERTRKTLATRGGYSPAPSSSSAGKAPSTAPAFASGGPVPATGGPMRRGVAVTA